MSNRLTFSLASLILIFALAFVTMPAMAETGGPTPTITAYSGANDPNAAPHATDNPPHVQEDDDFRILVTFNALVTGDVAEASFTIGIAEASGKATETPTATGIGTVVPITRGSNNGKAYMVPFDLTSMASTSHTAGEYSFGYISFTLNEDVVTGNQGGHTTEGIQNVRSAPFRVTDLPKNNDWTFTPTLGDVADGYLAGGKLKTTKTFDVKFTAGGGTGAVPTLAANQIQLRDKNGELIDTTAGSITATAPAPVGLVTTVTYTVGAADVDTPVTVGVNPNWAAGSTLRIPPATTTTTTKTAIKPTVDIALVGAVNETAKTFEVKFTFAKATVNAATQTADAVPDELMAGQITIQKQDPNDAEEMVDSEAYVQPNSIITLRSGVFLATVNYRLDPLPLYVGTSVDVSATTIGGMALAADADPVLTVAAPDAPNNAPVFTATGPLSITGMVGTEITAADASATDADSDTLTYSWDVDQAALGLMLNTASGMITGTPLKAHTMDHTVTVMDGNGGSATLMVSVAITAAGNGNGNGGGPSVVEPAEKTPVIRIPTQNDSSGPIELGSRFVNPMIPAHGWAVLVRDADGSHTFVPQSSTWIRSVSTSLPDLALFFGGRGGINSGTISLHKPAGNSAAADDIVISEIMWGVDNANAADPTCSQWIEFYNTTTSAIDLTGWTINFHRSLVDQRSWTTPTLVDFASNAGVTDRFPVHKYHHPWAPKGQSGLFSYGATGVNIVSMFLEINYTQANNVKHVVPSGAAAGAWSASVYPQSNLPFGIVGTPGARTEVRINYTETAINQKLIINEIGNDNENDSYDWIEIYNPGTANQTTKNMRLTEVWNAGTAAAPVGRERILFTFPDRTIKPGHYVVFAASHPDNRGNDLAAGIDITKSDANQQNRGLGSHVGIEHQANNTTAFYQVHGAVKLPNENRQRLYILRGNDKIGSHPDAQKDVVDVIGSLAIRLRNRTPAGWTGAVETDRGLTHTDAAHVRRIFDTTLWPLQWAVVDPGKKHPHGERVDGGAPNLSAGKVFQRNGKGLPNAKNHLTTAGYTGVGYDRHAEVNAGNGGTPGYPNNAVKGDKSNWNLQVSISEIMLATHEIEDDAPRIPRSQRLPQWIEIFNNSLTEGVSLNNWYLELRNADSEDLITRDLHGTLRLPNVIIPPNQTVLIVSSSGHHSQNFPAQRLINLYTDANARNVFSLLNRNDPVLSQVGFYIQLRDHKNNFVDEIGNLPATARRGVEARGPDNFTPVWELPEMNHPDGPRTSLIRVYDDGIPNDGLLPVADLSLEMKQTIGWRRALDTTFLRVPGNTFYGNQNDIGTPGYRGGGPLPVSLSKFRPERLDDGTVVIRWITESELNNAGFNILRSDTRSGEFTKINTQLIKGHGTTSERNAYEWTDKSAKPNVAYYYQIQDVSIDGDIQTLRVSRLKGNVSAAGKLTTTWGELKTLQ